MISTGSLNHPLAYPLSWITSARGSVRATLYAFFVRDAIPEWLCGWPYRSPHWRGDRLKAYQDAVPVQSQTCAKTGRSGERHRTVCGRPQ